MKHLEGGCFQPASVYVRVAHRSVTSLTVEVGRTDDPAARHPAVLHLDVI